MVTLGQASQRSAPTLWLRSNEIIAGWVAVDDDGVRQYLRGYDGELTDATTLPIPPVYPYDQTLLRAGDSASAHLFWLDAAYNNISGGLRLWGEVVTQDLQRVRAEIPLSDDVTYHYDALHLETGGVRLVWSSGNSAEPTLYTREIDPEGRPREIQRVAPDADWPAILPLSAGRVAVYWLSRQHGVAGRTILDDDDVIETEILVSSVDMDAGDQLLSFDVGEDQTRTYLLWNVRRASGDVETWVSHATNTLDVWAEPSRLSVDIFPRQPFATGFNGGSAQRALNGETPVKWAAPLRGRFDQLAVAAQIEDTLGVLYLRNGAVVGFQPVIDLPAPGLIGQPALYADRERHLYLTWAQPNGVEGAALNLTMTRTFGSPVGLEG